MPDLLPSFTTVAFLGLLQTAVTYIPWSLIFLFTRFLGLHLYVPRDREVCLRIQRRLTWTTHTADGDKPCGYAIGRWYLLQLTIQTTENGDKFDAWILSTPSSYKALTAEGGEEEKPLLLEGAPPPPPKHKMTIFSRTGSYYTVWFKKRTVSLDTLQPRPEQVKILEQIEAHLRVHQHTVAYVHGPPGSGKSILGPLLAFRLKGSYCNTMRPWQPGDTLAELYNEAQPSAEQPLVLAFDEFDTPLLSIHTGLEPHKNLPTLVADKTGWNHFFDEIGRGLYPHLVVLLTSNRDPEFIRGLDPSYIREGRVNIVAELNCSA